MKPKTIPFAPRRAAALAALLAAALAMPLLPPAWPAPDGDGLAYAEEAQDAPKESSKTPEEGSENSDEGKTASEGPGQGAPSPLPSGSYKITYRNAEEGFAASADDLFSHFGRLVPGESRTTSLLVSNESSSAIEVYLTGSLESDRTLGETSDFGSKALLSISSEEGGIYSGSLASAALSDGILFASLDAGASSSVEISVTVPADAGNEYALMDADAVWTFSAQESPAPAVSPDDPAPADFAEPQPTADPAPSHTAVPNAEPSQKSEATVPLAKTGSGYALIAIASLGAVAAIAAIAAFAAKGHAYARTSATGTRIPKRGIKRCLHRLSVRRGARR